jgi:ATP-dependent DNA helicase RecQ
MNSIIKSYHHDRLELFGAGKDHSVRLWNAVIHQGLILRLLYKDIESYGLISVTEAGKAFLENPYELMLTEDREFVEGDDDDDDVPVGAGSRGGGGGDEQLLAMLKDLRKDLAHRLRLQPWVIFSDPSLEDMSIMYPVSVEELKNCQGVGEGKARKYGKEFLALIEKYVEENDIDRPTDFVVKSVANKALNKVYIIQSIDKKIPLDEIADAKNMELEQVYSELEAIVAAGTKINIDYYIRQVVDEDNIDDIYDYFKEEAVTDSVNDALKALGRDYSEEEVRLIRIKFMSELGN